MLPERIRDRTKVKRPKRESRWRSDAHRDFVRDHACANCGTKANIQAAHLRIGSGAGMGQKGHDWLVTPLCLHCHDRQHAIGEPTFWQEYKATHGQSVEQLLSELQAASPKAREIRDAMRERGL